MLFRSEPGTSTGSLEVASANLQAGSTLDIELGGTGFDLNVTEEYDRLKVTTGTATLAGDLTVALVNPFTLGSDQRFGIVNAAGTGGRSGTFSNYAEGATILTNNGYDLKITYAGSVTDTTVAQFGGSDVVLYTVAVPEPGTIGLLLVCLSLLALAWRRRKQP